MNTSFNVQYVITVVSYGNVRTPYIGTSLTEALYVLDSESANLKGTVFIERFDNQPQLHSREDLGICVYVGGEYAPVEADEAEVVDGWRLYENEDGQWLTDEFSYDEYEEGFDAEKPSQFLINF